MNPDRVRRIGAVVGREIREALPPFVFFLILFHLIALTKAVVLEEYSFTALRATFATVGALIVAKAILLVEALPIARLFAAQKLAQIVWKTLLFAAVALAFRVLEELVPLISKYGGVADAVRRMLDEVHWPLFWVVALWIVGSLFLYCAVAEIVRAVGSDRVRALFFAGPGEKSV
ncbi:MAG: hypothetical protein R3357_08165 [Burkholderiales bacterium]|nr:hypothetical protein [Burkholderiales bacterium]